MEVSGAETEIKPESSFQLSVDYVQEPHSGDTVSKPEKLDDVLAFVTLHIFTGSSINSKLISFIDE
jgi:hypothetical protein